MLATEIPLKARHFVGNVIYGRYWFNLAAALAARISTGTKIRHMINRMPIRNRT
jgi:hypothetical protein